MVISVKPHRAATLGSKGFMHDLLFSRRRPKMAAKSMVLQRVVVKSLKLQPQDVGTCQRATSYLPWMTWSRNCEPTHTLARRFYATTVLER